MEPLETHLPEEQKFLYGFNLPAKKEVAEKFMTSSGEGSQFLQPLLEFSGACAGCGETPYVKMLSQLFGNRLVVANATGCSSIYGGNLPTTPWSHDSEGRGPAWSNSLFEDNAEFGLGFRVSLDKQMEHAIELLHEAAGIVGQELVDQILTNPQKDEADIAQQRENIAELKKRITGKPECARLLTMADKLVRKSVWILGGDGWAYDIGYGGLDHILASGRNVKVLVMDTEVYSNTGGQSSKATPVGAVAQFQASGKKTKKKDLGMLMMTYDNVYVAQCSMGANPNQLIKAIKEAEAHKGPSIVICYAPCINHGIKKGMNNVQQEMKDAVNSGYWNLYRYSPETKTFTLDSKEPSMALYDFMKGEVRYSSLELSFPENAKVLFAEAEEAAKEKYESYKRRAEK